ncbi:MAG TPA: phosphoribosylaminoimidazolesuccinocarboxamide synthase [Xanthomonadales bacterium]|nr:phosphoribosylaminoimidazolesuccinocarboxamide synthase [Xanthomonadales bacterium]
MISSLPLIHQGKVRDSFAIDDDLMLIVASDRLSAFDVVLPDLIPGKGEILTRLSNFWFDRTRHIIDNHLTDIEVADVIKSPAERYALRDRAVVVKRLKPLPVEAVARGFLIGSAWKDYQATGSICGMELPPGLLLADKLPRVLFTPSSKAPAGQHDENISFADMENLLGKELALKVKDATIDLFRYGVGHGLQRGIIIADTKFEFGLDKEGKLLVMDEMLTPDSSRFWPVELYYPGKSPPSFDKQYIRDHLEAVGWNKKPPAPHLPDEVIAATIKNYEKAYRKLSQGPTEGGTDGFHLPPAR